MGQLALAKGTPYTARDNFESALTHAPNHPSAIVGLSNILLDIYTEDLLPPPSIPPLDGIHPSYTCNNRSSTTASAARTLPTTPLGLGTPKPTPKPSDPTTSYLDDDQLPAPYKAQNLPLVDRLAARDRAYGLLSALTKLGTAWNMSEAWFALARAHEESGQPDKAKEVLWWCVELEEGTGVRDWRCLGSGGYIV